MSPFAPIARTQLTARQMPAGPFAAGSRDPGQETESVPLPLTRSTMMNPPHLGPSPAVDVTIPSDPDEARLVQERIEQLLLEQHASDRDIFCIKLAMEEALINAIKHGNQMDRGKKVRISYRVLPDRFECRISDEGQGFDPNDVPDPTAVENLERPCGRGLMLMRHYMNDVVYNPVGNVVSMSRVFKNQNGKK
jgi:serine/threonine-protein kinase RsbW